MHGQPAGAAGREASAPHVRSTPLDASRTADTSVTVERGRRRSEHGSLGVGDAEPGKTERHQGVTPAFARDQISDMP